MKNDNDNMLERLWRAGEEKTAMTREEIAAVLRPRVVKSARVLHGYVYGYLLAQLLTLVLAGANLSGYQSNPVMRAVEGAIAALAIAFAGYGIWLAGEVRWLDRMDLPLAQVVERRLRFHRTHYRNWLWITSLSLVLLTFALNSLVDNQGGSYRINQPLVFAGVQIAMVVFLAVGFRLAHAPYVAQLEATLGALEAQLLDRSQAAEQQGARRRRWQQLLAVLLLGLFVLGTWLALQMGN